MKSVLISVVVSAALMAIPPSSASTITRQQMDSMCETAAQTATLVHKAHEQDVSRRTILKQINNGVTDQALLSEHQQLVEDVYATPEPASYRNWNDVAMQSCVAAQKANLPVEDSGPVVLWRAERSWPIAAALARHQGTVVIRVLIKEDSTVGYVQLISSSGSEKLDQAAIREVKHWEYRASVVGGQFHDGYIQIPLTFGGTATPSPATQ